MDTIQFKDVWKEYEIGFGQRGLRHVLTDLPKQLFRKEKQIEKERFFALREINLLIQTGEAVGLIGRNGAGKTTVLKLISRITKPTLGEVNVLGRVSALIELGAGFHPELTGRENIFLNGTILGLSRAEIRDKFDQIVEFAELEKFIDTPVKRYSSGMYARLGFSVAAHTNPEILLVDEVLAVGDKNFQQKCLDFIHSFVRGGNTTLFVSHNLYVVEQLCDRLVWLDEGKIVQEGRPGEIVQAYSSFLEEHTLEHVGKKEESQTELAIQELWTCGENNEQKQLFDSHEPLSVHIRYQTRSKVEKPHFCIWVSASLAPEPLFAANMLIDGQAPDYIDGQGVLRCTFYDLNLMPRKYYIWLEVYGKDGAKILFTWQRLGSFQIKDEEVIESGKEHKGAMRFIKYHAPVRVDYEWKREIG